MQPFYFPAQVFLTSALLTLSTNLYAQATHCNLPAQAPETQEQSGFLSCWYGGLEINYALLDPDSGSSGLEVTDDSDTGWSAALGWRFSNNWFAEFKYSDHGNAEVSNPPSQADIGYKTNSLMLGYDLLAIREHLHLYVKVGLADVNGSVSNSSGLTLDDDEVQLSAGAGLEYRLSNPWFARLNADFYSKDVQSIGLSINRYLEWPVNTGSGDRKTSARIDSSSTKIAQDCAKLSGTLKNVQFESNSSYLKASAKKQLIEYARVLKRFPETEILVLAHTDSTGEAAYNLFLSDRRAKSVVRFLVNQGIAAEQLDSEGIGELAPIASNETAEGRAENRRVEFSIVKSDACL